MSFNLVVFFREGLKTIIKNGMYNHSNKGKITNKLFLNDNLSKFSCFSLSLTQHSVYILFFSIAIYIIIVKT